MRYLFASLSLCLLSACATVTEPEPGWVPLFNGEDLTGWQVKFKNHPAGVNYKNTFRASDGILSVDYSEYDAFNDAFGHIFTEGSYSNYRLRFEYRMIGEPVPGGPEWGHKNSGAIVHSEPAGAMALTQPFPRSIEAQLLGGGQTTANVCTPGTHVVIDGELVTEHCVASSSELYRADRWIPVEIEVRGGELIRHKVYGETVLEYSTPIVDTSDVSVPSSGFIDGAHISSGHIAFQAESQPVEFRNIEILETN